MVKISDFQLVRVHSVAYISTDVFNPASILRQALRDWGDIYNGAPTSLPIPDLGAMVPPDLPLVQLVSQDSTQRLNVARSRLDLLWSRQNTTAPEIIPTLATFAERLATIAESSKVSICRLAALVTRVTEYADPGIALARHFCRDQWITGPLNRPEGFELHTHKVFTLLDEIRVNSWIRIKAIKIGVGPYNRISIEQDINTLAEEVDKRHFTRQELTSWFEAAGGELDTILAMYFPDNRPNS